MRTCMKPQFWQSSSTRTPGWNERPCARHAALVRSEQLWHRARSPRTGASRRSVAERLADTTSSIEMPFCATSKFSSSVSPRFSATEVLFGRSPGRGLRASAPFRKVFQKIVPPKRRSSYRRPCRRRLSRHREYVRGFHGPPRDRKGWHPFLRGGLGAQHAGNSQDTRRGVPTGYVVS